MLWAELSIQKSCTVPPCKALQSLVDESRKRNQQVHSWLQFSWRFPPLAWYLSGLAIFVSCAAQSHSNSYERSAFIVLQHGGAWLQEITVVCIWTALSRCNQPASQPLQTERSQQERCSLCSPSYKVLKEACALRARLESIALSLRGSGETIERPPCDTRVG